MGNVTGKDAAFEMCPGLPETRFYAARGVPAFAYGPGLRTVSHGPNEFVPIGNIVRRAEMLALTAAWMLHSPGVAPIMAGRLSGFPVRKHIAQLSEAMDESHM
jgi:hypothetical protein